MDIFVKWPDGLALKRQAARIQGSKGVEMSKLPPKAKKIPTETVWHGHTLRDDYAWLRQENWKEMFADTKLLREDIRDYLDAENAYTEENLVKPNRELIGTLVAELKARTEIDYDSAPEEGKLYEYFERYSEAEYPVYLRRPIGSTQEEVILDVNKELAKDGRKVFLEAVEHSPDDKYLAIAVDFSGSEKCQILLKDLQTGEFISDDVQNVGDIVWAPDSKSIYYAKYSDDPALFRRDRIFEHRLGDKQEQNRLIFTDLATDLYLGLSKTSSERFLIIRLWCSSRAEMHLLDLEKTNAMPFILASRDMNMLYEVDHVGEYLYIRTNANDAVDFKIMRTAIDKPQIEYWQDYIPHKPGCLIQSIKSFECHLVCLQMEQALPQIAVTDLRDNKKHVVAFEEAAYALHLGEYAGFEKPVLRFSYSSPRTPLQVYNYDLNDRTRKLVRQEKIPAHNPENYVLERILVPSHDGVKVPMTLMRHKDTKLDGSAPGFLYGYGSYGHGLPASFGHFKNCYSLLDRGFVCADAHIRGGTECGFGWYLDGKLMKKKNTFLDFISCAQWLADNKYCARGHIAGEGGSAGGLLMGAVANMAPEGLFGAIVADVPFVDVMNTILDDTLPLTPPEWGEWGNPIKDKVAYEYMLSYSPYDNVTAKNYPAFFISGGLTDPRVTYWEPAKWTAKLRELKTDNNPLYLHITMDAGHGGDPGRFGRYYEIARQCAFIIGEVGDKK
jgi:oligopeptidase B